MGHGGRVRSASRDTTDLLRSVGGVLFAAGSVVLYVRKAGHHAWGDFALLLVVLIPALVLYALALGVGEARRSDEAEPWRSVLMVVAILLGPLVLGQLLSVLGADTGQALYVAGIFVVTGLIAAYGAQRAHTSYAVLLAGLALLVAWLIVWGKVLDHPSVDAFRLLLIVVAALLLMAATTVDRIGAIGAGELATIGGIAAVAAGGIGVIVGILVGVTRPITEVIESSHSVGHGLHGALPTSGFQHFGWDLYLLVVSVALVWVGSRLRARGLGYVGGFGLLAFVVSVGAQVTRLESGRAPTADLIGWPLALLVCGVAGIVASALYRRDA
jgi:hypothetical protein